MSTYGLFKPLTTSSGTAGDVAGPATNTADFIPQWNGSNSKALKNGKAAPAGTIVGTSDTQTLDSKTLTAAGDITHASGKQWKPKGATATGTGDGTNGGGTVNQQCGVIETEALTTSVNGFYFFTLTNSLVAATSLVFASVSLGTSLTGVPCVTLVIPHSGSATIIIKNVDASFTFNGTLKIAFLVVNPG